MGSLPLSISAAPFAGFSVSTEDCAATLATGATANSACLKGLQTRDCRPDKHGIPATAAYSATASLKFATDVPAAIARCRGKLTAFLVGADTPALLFNGGLGNVGGEVGLLTELYAPCEIWRQGSAPFKCGRSLRFKCGVF